MQARKRQKKKKIRPKESNAINRMTKKRIKKENKNESRTFSYQTKE